MLVHAAVASCWVVGSSTAAAIAAHPPHVTGYSRSGFAGRLLEWATQILATTISIVGKPADQRGFAVIPRRWAVERTLAWPTAHRRPARDYERHRPPRRQ